MDRPRYEWWRGVFVVRVFVAHAAFSRQEVKALTSCVIFSALTSPSTVMRQPMLSLSPCATILPKAEAAVIAWMRHQTTGYDNMIIARIEGQRREIRQRLAQRSRELLDKYRRGNAVSEKCPLRIAIARG